MSLGKVDIKTFSLDNYGFPDGLTVYQTPTSNNIITNPLSGGEIVIESSNESVEEVPIELITNADLKVSK
jgi:hypothetical protein